MRLAICDDEERELSRLRELLTEYRNRHDPDLEYRMFSSGTDLLFGMRGGEYDAIVMDVLMPGFSGIQTARELRTLDQNVKILFLTSTPEFAVESYSVDAYHYLLKPPTAKTLFPLLDAMRKELSAQTEEGLLLHGREGVVRISFSQLEYVEVVNKTVSFHLTDGSVRDLPATLADFEETLLSRPEFRKIHRSYLVNLRHIQAINVKSAMTRAGHTVPISRALYGKVKADYMQFLFEGDDSSPSPMVRKLSPAPPVQPVEKRTDGPWRLLIVDDKQEDLTYWAAILRANGCVVEVAENAASALHLAKVRPCDCVLLDVLLPNESGFDLCARLRKLTGAPVVFLSCLTDTETQLRGFTAGGVDYITKDTPAELFWAKVESRLRISRARRTQLRFGPLLLDLSQRRATLEDVDFVLTPTEFDLLWTLSEHARQVFTPEEIFSAVWGAREWDGGQTVQVHMSRLRRKLEKAYPTHSFIETVWGQGYRFTPTQ